MLDSHSKERAHAQTSVLDPAEVRATDSGEFSESGLGLAESETSHPNLKPVLPCGGPEVRRLVQTHGTIHLFVHIQVGRVAVREKRGPQAIEMRADEAQETEKDLASMALRPSGSDAEVELEVDPFESDRGLVSSIE